MDNSRRLLILYGSQTGCAQEVAERIWRESKWFAVLGLGDSSYVKFNHVAKKLYRRLIQLGGKPLCEIGLADDQHDIGAFAVIDPWIDNLWNILIEKHPLTNGLTPIDRNSLPPPKWNVNTLSSNISIHTSDKLPNNDLLKPNSTIVTCLSNTRTTTENHFQDVRLLKFEYSENSINYSPGDVLMVRPVNSETSVNNFFQLLNDNKNMKLNPTTVLNVTQCSNDMPIPYNLCKPFTLYQCAKYYWDLNIIPNRYIFQLLSYFTDNELEKEKLKEFTTPEGQDELYSYCNRPRRTILEVLADFPHATAKVSLEYLFEIFSPIRPRAFSIASAPSVHINEIHLLVAVVTYKTKLLAKRTGLCSTWLASLNIGDKIPVWIQKGTFQFPYSQSCNAIMIGPGTGVAPFRSFVHEAVAKKCGNAKTLHLYFGGRNRLGDFHCVNDWEKLVVDEKLSLYTAFSRDQNHKIYVQHILEQNEEELLKLLSTKECYVFVAGNAKDMPTAVKNVFINILTKNKHLNTIDMMETKGFYQTETWS